MHINSQNFAHPHAAAQNPLSTSLTTYSLYRQNDSRQFCLMLQQQFTYTSKLKLSCMHGLKLCPPNFETVSLSDITSPTPRIDNYSMPCITLISHYMNFGTCVSDWEHECSKTIPTRVTPLSEVEVNIL